MTRIPVLVFAESFRTGGSERQAVELVKRLDRRRFAPLLACFRPEGPLRAELPADLEALEVFPISGFARPNALRQAVRFGRMLRRHKVRVVQCFDFYSNVFAIPVARAAGVPVVLGARRDEASVRSAKQRRLERVCFGLATGVVTNARRIERQLVGRDGLRPGRVWTVPNLLDLERFDRLRGAGAANESGRTRVAVVANLRPEKGHLVFLEAAARLAGEISELDFLIVGEGPMRPAIEAKVRELGLSDRVTMCGEVTNVAALLPSFDVVVLPSLTNEGLPNAVMEAMAAGRPVVATDTGGSSELVVDGVTGFVVPPAEPVALAERMRALCLDASLRTSMGRAGRRRIEEHFDPAKIVGGFEALFTDLLARPKAERRMPRLQRSQASTIR